ncbi:MAG: cytochrome oxidase mono-heme subunit/FixO [Verrucomicrobiales bacterium]|nr:cytochrome oxidase mono-heme subunit/FixO [Verrucomicrobiales bacterium]
MNHGPFLFLGLFATFAWSWFALVLKPQNELGTLEPEKNPVTGEVYPLNRAGAAQQGRDVYRANGCAACHTQQVRSRESGSDMARGWGVRPTVARDFIFDNPAMPGVFRIGPDLANVGNRQRDPKWHFSHLYNPRIKSPGSSMPPYRYLFEKHKTGVAPSADAIDTGTYSPGAGYEILPTDEARSLVDYMMSLKADTYIFEVPNPHPSTNAPTGTTNAVAGAVTNAPTQ